jgi:hypothetical protein
MTHNATKNLQKPEFENDDYKNPEDEINTEVAISKEKQKLSSLKEFFGSPSSVEHAFEIF